MRILRKVQHKLNWSPRRYVAVFVGLLALGYLASGIYHTVKPLPKGLNYTGKLRHAQVKFLADLTYLTPEGKQQQQHVIFNEMLKMIDEAKTTIVLDMFLFNKEVGVSKVQQQALTQQLTDALISKRRQYPEMDIKFITDPIN